MDKYEIFLMFKAGHAFMFRNTLEINNALLADGRCLVIDFGW